MLLGTGCFLVLQDAAVVSKNMQNHLIIIFF